MAHSEPDGDASLDDPISLRFFLINKEGVKISV